MLQPLQHSDSTPRLSWPGTRVQVSSGVEATFSCRIMTSRVGVGVGDGTVTPVDAAGDAAAAAADDDDDEDGDEAGMNMADGSTAADLHLSLDLATQRSVGRPKSLDET